VFDRSTAAWHRSIDRLRRRFREEMAGGGEPRVVIVGRPYTVLSPGMNKGIPAIFATLGVKTFFQDMVPYRREEVAELAPLLEAFHWQYAAEALEVALVAARTPLLYPVYVTSFKCSPDSFALEYFKRILDAHDKPYLVLQLDAHDSSVGHETRIEAGGDRVPQPRGPHDPRRGRRGARGGHPTPARAATHRRASGWPHPATGELRPAARPAARGQPAPRGGRRAPAARGRYLDPCRDALQHRPVHPARTLVWMARSGLSCNLPLFPAYMKTLFESLGGGMERLDV